MTSPFMPVVKKLTNEMHIASPVINFNADEYASDGVKVSGLIDLKRIHYNLMPLFSD